MGSKYKIRALESFQQDLFQIADYITSVLNNADAADRLVTRVTGAIRKRAENPLSFEAFHSSHDRKNPYYRIYVGNYIIIFYVVIGDVMEVRRLVYKSRDIWTQI